MSRLASNLNPISAPPHWSLTWLWGVRVLAAGAGVASGSLALWIFYYRPWLGGTSNLNPWLDEHRCLVRAWCGLSPALQEPLALLAALVAVLCFGLACLRWPWVWQPERSTPALPSWASRPPRLRRLIGGLVALCLLITFYQAYQTLFQAQPPALPLWLLGLVTALAAASLWDWADPDPLTARTWADLGVAAAMLLLILAAALLVAQRHALGGGLALAGGLFYLLTARQSLRLGSTLTLADHALMLGLALVALLLGTWRAWSWRYAFIGDEWGFFEYARSLNHGSLQVSLLGLRDRGDYHTVFSSALQAWTMRLAGEDMYGWRLSSLLPMVLSVPPVYLFIRWLAGRPAAVLGGALLAGSHLLLSFSMVPYNNTQALLPLTLGLGCFVSAVESRSVLRYLLLGALLGLAFYVYGLARVALLPIGLLLLFHTWPGWRRLLGINAIVAAGGLAVASPMLFNLDNWRVLLKATPVQSEVAADGTTLLAQMATNAIAALLAFLTSSHNTHYVAGPHTDPLTALLMLAGLGLMLASLVDRRRPGSWLVAATLFVLAVGAVQQYGWISTTRTFILAPIYAIYAGLGGAALASLTAPENPGLQRWLIMALVAAGLLLNQLHIVQIAWPRSHQPFEALLIQQLLESSASDRGGMPVFIVPQTPTAPREVLLAHTYDVGRERLIFLSDSEALTLPDLCAAAERPAMALLHVRNPQVELLRSHLAACWPNGREIPVRNHLGEAWYYRWVTQPGQIELLRPPAQRQSWRPRPDTLAVPRPGDIAIDPQGSLYVLALAEARIYRFDAAGRPAGTLSLPGSAPSALAFTPDGLLLVADSGGAAPLAWLRPDGGLVREGGSDLGLGPIRGLAVATDGRIVLVDTAHSRLVQLDAGGEWLGTLTGGGRLSWPASVALAPDGSLWVFNSGSGDLLHLSPTDEVLARLALEPSAPEEAPRLALLANGDLLVAQPHQGRVVRFDPMGRLLQIWSGFDRPIGLALDDQRRLWVADRAIDQVASLPPVPAELPPVDLPQLGPGSRLPASAQLGALRLPSQVGMEGGDAPLPPYFTATAVAGGLYFSPKPPGRLRWPRGIALFGLPDAVDYQLVVADTGYRRLLRLTPDGSQVEQMEPDAAGFVELTDLATDLQGRVIALDSGAGALWLLADLAQPVQLLLRSDDILGGARGVTVDGAGRIWIADTPSGRLVQLDANGGILGVILLPDSAAAQPVDVALLSSGQIFVTEASTHRLLRLSPAGLLEESWPLPAFNTGDGAHLAVDRADRLYITAPEQGVITQMDGSGSRLQEWALRRADGSMAKPVGVAVGQDAVWTVDVDRGSLLRLPLSP